MKYLFIFKKIIIIFKKYIMETDRNNISEKFKEIKNNFGYSTNKTKKSNLKISFSHSNFIKRPKLPKIRNQSIDNKHLNTILDQIGNDDLIFNNDKLITNIKIESFENPLNKNSIISIENDNKSFISKRTNKTNSTSLNRRKNSKQKNNLYQNRNKLKEFSLNNNDGSSLELNCNKFPYINENKKKQNHINKNGKKNKSSNKNKNICVKNVDQFINKPNEHRRTSNKTNKSIMMTPISNKTSMRINNNKKIFKNNEFHSSQRSFINFNNDSISLASTSRLDISKSYIRGRSMPSMKSNRSQSNLRLPNKSITKNQDKIIIELQKLFGDKITLTEDIYHNLTELDKKNCINFLLEVVKEMNNTNKINKAKTDGYKQIIESKEQDIKNLKNEIKELKKENIKLNKIIKTNNQLNKKLSQNLDTLKIQLEKEKNKIKNLKSRGKSTSKMNNIYSNKYLKESSINKNRKHKEVKSQDKIKKASGFINRKKSEDINEKKINNLSNPEQNKNNIDDKDKINILWKNKEENKTNNPTNSIIIDVDSNDKKDLIVKNEN